MVYEPDYDELERLFVNNSSLQAIEKHLNTFNPIKVMKMERMEIRHSAILAWLLTPTETHGLHDKFLKSFLAEALRGSGHKYPHALHISQADLRDADVRCEWKGMDIFILSPKNRWAFIIENKVFSTQSDNQLTQYKERAREIYRAQADEPEKDVAIRGIFLTLHEEAPADSDFTSIRYDAVCAFIKLYCDQEAYLLIPEVNIFLTHYVHVLEELMDTSIERNEMKKIARNLYREHKKVLDFIIEHGAGSDFSIAVCDAIGENLERGAEFDVCGRKYVYAGLNNRQLSFLPASWYRVLNEASMQWQGCEKWETGLPVMCHISLWPEEGKKRAHLKLVAAVGPLTDPNTRSALIHAIEALKNKNGLKISFQKDAAARRTSGFLRKNHEDLEDIQDNEDIAHKIRSLIERFSPEFDAVADILPAFMQHEGLQKVP